MMAVARLLACCQKEGRRQGEIPHHPNGQALRWSITRQNKPDTRELSHKVTVRGGAWILSPGVSTSSETARSPTFSDAPSRFVGAKEAANPGPNPWNSLVASVLPGLPQRPSNTAREKRQWRGSSACATLPSGVKLGRLGCVAPEFRSGIRFHLQMDSGDLDLDCIGQKQPQRPLRPRVPKVSL
jgi:hypothetical protein